MVFVNKEKAPPDFRNLLYSENKNRMRAARLRYSLSLTVTLTLSPGCFPIRERISFRTPII